VEERKESNQGTRESREEHIRDRLKEIILGKVANGDALS
jgi:hypothetical protein